MKFIIEIKFLILFGWVYRMVPIGSFYLGASSTTPSSAAFGRPQSMSQASLPFSPTNPPSNNPARVSPTSYRASMPAPARGGSSPGLSSAFINQPSTAGKPRFESTLEEGDDPSLQQVELERATSVGSVTNVESKRKSRGVINPEFKFPTSSMSGPGKDSSPSVIEDQSSLTGQWKQGDEVRPAVVTPSSIEVPAPPLVEKERMASRASLDEADDDLGDTVDIPLN